MKKIIKHKYFSKSELEKIYNEYPQSTNVEIRDKVLLGLYVFQGLKSSEIKNVIVEDILLDKFRMGTNGDRMSNARLLDLDVQQLTLLIKYIKIHRNQLLNGIETENLIVTSKNKSTIEAVIRRLSKKLVKKVYGFENFNQVRKNVIHNWSEKHDLRVVQYLSGHRYISSTKIVLKNYAELYRRI
ncbi:MAG: site-specific integrase [Urechidicola sp.]|nr:site-specific integrase [Urechidicola sp.]